MQIEILIEGENHTAPKAMPDDKVMAHNYNRKVKDKKTGKLVDAGVWEEGRVCGTRTNWTTDIDGDPYVRHSYDVVLDRTRLNRYGEHERFVRLSLGDDGIEPIT